MEATINSTNHFDKFVTWLENNWAGFRIATLADQLNCSSESIRRWRNGIGEICTAEILALKKYYQANPLYLLEGTGPMRLTGDATVVMEPGVAYNAEVSNKIEQLEKQLRDKERIIQLLEKQPRTKKRS